MCVNAWYETSFILIYNNPLDIMLWFCTAEAMLLNIVLEYKEMRVYTIVFKIVRVERTINKNVRENRYMKFEFSFA